MLVILLGSCVVCGQHSRCFSLALFLVVSQSFSFSFVQSLSFASLSLLLDLDLLVVVVVVVVVALERELLERWMTLRCALVDSSFLANGLEG